MKKRRFKRHVILITTILAALIIIAGAQLHTWGDSQIVAAGPLDNPVSYTVTDLGPIVPFAINNLGQVAGWGYDLATFDAVLWDSGQIINLGPGAAHDVNDLGQVVGVIDNSEGDKVAFLWQDLNGNGQIDPGEMQLLGALPGGLDSVARGVNNLGQVVGSSRHVLIVDGEPYEYPRGFLWENGSMTDLGALAEDIPSTIAYAINDVGQIVGDTRWADGQGGYYYPHAFL